MPVPALRSDGTLPPGIHQATLDEVLAAFHAVSVERQTLDNALKTAITLIKQKNLAQQIALDGSYITSKPDPEDIDMAVLTPGIFQMDGEQIYAAEGIDLALLDIQFAHDAPDFQQWIDFFSVARNFTPKGIILLTL